MCRIPFQVQYEDLDTDVLVDWQGQYKIQGSSTWIPFEFDFTNPFTPDLITEGIYDLRVRIFDGRSWSDWFSTNFSIGCGAFSIGFSLGFDA